MTVSQVGDGKPILFLAMRPGPSARFLLRTEIFETLREADIEIVVLTPRFDVEHMRKAVGIPGLPVLPLIRKDRLKKVKGAHLRMVVQRMRRMALDGRRSAGYRDKYTSSITGWSERSPRLAKLVDLLVRFGLWRSRLLRELIVRAAVSVSPSYHDHLFERYSPSLVVTTGLGYAYWDEGILQEATRRHVPTAALVQNWDNPTTSGYRAAPLDLVVAWSERMRRQLIELHDVPHGRIRIGGVPHWDSYLRPGALPSRAELFARVGADPDRRTLLHASHRPGPDVASVELASVLAELVSEQAFGDDVQLVIRVHPMFMLPQYEAESGAFRRLADQYATVHVHYPHMISRKYMDIDPEDTPILGALLKYCDALVNVFSTTTLEAFIFDRPVVMAGPQAHLYRSEQLESASAELNWGEFAHLEPVVKSGAPAVAHSREALVREIGECLAHPEARRALREVVVREECGPTDGYAGRRTAMFLLEALGARPPEEPAAAAGRSPSPGVPAPPQPK